MATVNTQITSLEVNGTSVTATFKSTNTSKAKFEAKLDGWQNWREVTSPATFTDLAAGDRTLYVRSYSRKGIADPTPATKTFTVAAAPPPPPPDPDPEPTPDPEPSGNWNTVKVYKTLADWNNNTLIEGLDGATITEVDGNIRYFIPGPQEGERCETQIYIGKEGQNCAYDYSFYIPSSTKLSTYYSGDPKNIISQHHGDKNAGYTGGVSVYPNGDISLRIKGGHEWSMQGSHPYEYENELRFGNFKRDTWNHVRLEILWHRTNGSARARLNDGTWASLSGVPTWPLGDSDGVPSTVIMYRHGWYPQGGHVQGDMDIRFSPLTFQLAA